jgi:hypothetical protein
MFLPTGEVNSQGLTKEDATRMMDVSRKQTESVVKELLRKVRAIFFTNVWTLPSSAFFSLGFYKITHSIAHSFSIKVKSVPW